MGVIAGKEGKFSAGGSPTVVGKTKEYSFTDEAEELGYSVLQDDWSRAEAGMRTLSGSISLVYDPADAGQTALIVPGTKVALSLFPQGETSGLPKITFSALIKSAEYTVAADGLVEAACQFRNDGAVTYGTVT